MKIILGVLAILCLAPISRVQAEQAGPVTAGDVIDVGNAICPVSGDEVSSKANLVFGGKRYHFCCEGCIKKFKKDPQKYIAKLQAEAAPLPAAGAQEEMGHEQGHGHEGHEHHHG